MANDKEIDELILDELEKDITQETSIDEDSVEQSLGEMGYLWDTVSTKLSKDGICFNCKKEIDFTKEKVSVLEATKVEKGVCAFITVCEECKKTQEKTDEKGENDE